MRPTLLLGWFFAADYRPWHAAEAEAKVDFQRQIRPLLSDTCFVCHGPDAGSRKGKLRLDQARFRPQRRCQWRAGHRAGEGFRERPRSPGSSRHDADEVMPPPKTGKTIAPAQVKLIEKWIDQGADYQTHWGFLLPQRPKLPEVKDAAWAKSPIDRFVLARLEKEGMTPSKPAEKTTLIRRSIARFDRAAADRWPRSMPFWPMTNRGPLERLVDRLLASPHYGERWGRHWLDGARYADSDGYEKDKPRSVWMYRDWVVSAPSTATCRITSSHRTVRRRSAARMPPRISGWRRVFCATR